MERYDSQRSTWVARGIIIAAIFCRYAIHPYVCPEGRSYDRCEADTFTLLSILGGGLASLCFSKIVAKPN